MKIDRNNSQKERLLTDVIPSLDVAASKLECSPIYQAELAKTNFVDQVFSLMEENKINKSQLAKLIGKSPQYIGRVLNETANFTIEKMAEFACVFGKKIKITLTDLNAFQDNVKERSLPPSPGVTPPPQLPATTGAAGSRRSTMEPLVP